MPFPDDDGERKLKVSKSLAASWSHHASLGWPYLDFQLERVEVFMTL